MSVAENKQIVGRALEALMAGELNPLQELLAPDAVLHQCGFLDPIPRIAIVQGDFPGDDLLLDREIRLERMIAEGDIVALHWWTTGLFADSESPELHGRPVSFASMSFVRLVDGKIVEMWNIQDTSTMQTQLSK